MSYLTAQCQNKERTERVKGGEKTRGMQIASMNPDIVNIVHPVVRKAAFVYTNFVRQPVRGL